ncbi:uncharacterized protein [Littorina saxatilis]|uniref:Phytanoyl-CoA dioxygenase n=1 Tax=Littorina saxatilis TaxID=31220 RepID=A0AAN9G437_9CAEN
METHTSDTTGTKFDREIIMKELEEKGYCVIPNVLTSDECDVNIAAYRDWLAKFPEDEWPLNDESLIMTYRIGHSEPTWKVRLAAKKVFETVWQTKKLLSSFDSVAISPPPEQRQAGGRPVSSFAMPGYTWLHLDQSSSRHGLHCYQGAVYLEETCQTDYCLRVLPKSHKLFREFYDAFPEAAERGVKQQDFCQLLNEEITWYEQHGCHLTKVAVPKGGTVVWDSRLVHDNCKPERGRPNCDRWRFVVFVCMAPARWTTPKDLDKKRHAYHHLRMTTHWPAQNVTYFEEQVPKLGGAGPKTSVPLLEQLPEVAKSDEARMLAGVLEYDFEDGEPNGPDWKPVWVE